MTTEAQARLELDQADHEEDRVVFLANVWLDRSETFEALHTLLSGAPRMHAQLALHLAHTAALQLAGVAAHAAVRCGTHAHTTGLCLRCCTCCAKCAHSRVLCSCLQIKHAYKPRLLQAACLTL